MTLTILFGLMPMFVAAQDSANPTDLKSALGLSGDTASPPLEKQAKVAPKIAHANAAPLTVVKKAKAAPKKANANAVSSSAITKAKAAPKTADANAVSPQANTSRDGRHKQRMADHQKKAAKNLQNISAAVSTAHKTHSVHSSSLLADQKKLTAHTALLKSAVESKTVAANALHISKPHKAVQKLVSLHKHIAPAVQTLATNKVRPTVANQNINHTSRISDLNAQRSTSIKSDSSALNSAALPAKSHSASSEKIISAIVPALPSKKPTAAEISALSKKSAKNPAVNSASLYGQTKPDGLGVSQEAVRDHTQNSPIGAVNDSGKMMLFLIPTLAVLMIVLHFIRKFMEKNGNIGRLPMQKGSGKNSLAKWNFPHEKKTGLLKTFFAGLQKSPNAKRVGNIHVIESIPLGNTQIHLVEVRGRTLLLGANATGVNLLTELEDDEIDSIQDSFHSQFQAASAELSILDLTETETPLQSMVATLEDVMRETREAVSSRTRRLHTLREDEEFIV